MFNGKSADGIKFLGTERRCLPITLPRTSTSATSSTLRALSVRRRRSFPSGSVAGRALLRRPRAPPLSSAHVGATIDAEPTGVNFGARTVHKYASNDALPSPDRET